MIKIYAENHDMIYLDYFSSLVDERNGMKAEYSKDGVHPNKAGYIVMMDLFSKAINKALS